MTTSGTAKIRDAPGARSTRNAASNKSNRVAVRRRAITMWPSTMNFLAAQPRMTERRTSVTQLESDIETSASAIFTTAENIIGTGGAGVLAAAVSAAAFSTSAVCFATSCLLTSSPPSRPYPSLPYPSVGFQSIPFSVLSQAANATGSNSGVSFFPIHA